MNLTYREARDEEFEEFYRACYLSFGYGDGPRANVQREWSVLRARAYHLSLLVEDQDRCPADRAVAFAQAVFVTDDFARYARREMPPYVNVHVTSRLPDGSWPLLDYSGVAAGNSGPGLNALISHWGWAQQLLTEAESLTVRDFLRRSFIQYHGGYNLKEVLMEVVGTRNRDMAVKAGYELRRDYQDYYRSNPPIPPSDFRPFLLGLTRPEALEEEGSDASYLFVYNPPIFRFNRREEDLLLRASRGEADEEIASTLNRGLSTIKARWQTIFDKVAAKNPKLLPLSGEGTRGLEKRSRLLRYLQSHMEELRPHK
jgi:DNA-binding CsgD family transcriptional regulator